MTSGYRRHFSKTAAFGILLGVVLLLWGNIALPLWSAWSDRADQIDRLTELVGKLKARAAEAPALEAQLAQGTQPQEDRNSVFVAANPVLAGAELQSEVKRIAEAAGAQVTSVQQLPIMQEDALSRIELRAEIQSDTAQIGRMLYDLQVHTPVLIVRSLTIRGTEQSAGMNQKRPLSVRIEVASYAGPPS